MLPSPASPPPGASLQAGLRAAFAREWVARRVPIGCAIAALVPLLLLRDGTREAWALFELLLLTPLLAFGLGAAGDPRADRGWASFGGGPRDRLLGRLLVQGGLIGLSVLCPWWVISEPGNSVADLFEGSPLSALLLLVVVGTTALIYLSAALSRRHLAGIGPLAGPLALGVLVIGGGVIDWETGGWSVIEGVALRVTLLVPGCLVALLHREGRLPRPRDFNLAFAGAVVLSGLSLIPGAAWSGRPLFLPPVPVDLDEATGRALWVAQDALIFGGRRALLWQDGEWSVVGPAGANAEAALGPQGSRAFLVWPGSDHSGAGELVLESADGRSTRCPFERLAVRGVWGFSAAGAAGIRTGDPQAPAALLATPAGTCERAVALDCASAGLEPSSCGLGPFDPIRARALLATAGPTTLLGPER